MREYRLGALAKQMVHLHTLSRGVHVPERRACRPASVDTHVQDPEEHQEDVEDRDDKVPDSRDAHTL